MKKETIELSEEVLTEKLMDLKTMDPSDKGYQNTKDTAMELYDKVVAAEKMLIDESDKNAQRENDAERNRIEEADKAERREIERERNETQAEIEREKQKISWPKVILEMAKVTVPVVISGAIFKAVHEENMEFEETGAFHSSTGRGLTNVLNRFLKF